MSKNGTVIVQKGPMLMSISAFSMGKSDKTLAKLGANKALSLLEELAEFKTIIKRNIIEVEPKDQYPEIVNRMITSIKKIKDQTMTSLAAVAGSVADGVADFIFEREGASKIIVNNGGDIALRLRDNESVTVGIVSDLSKKKITHKLLINSQSGIGGICTSGFGGRSLTKGIASAAVALSSSSCVADAAATLLGNWTNIDDPLIERKLAEEIYPDTDIPGHLVTVKIGDINESKVKKALENGIAKARELQSIGLIFGAFLMVKGQIKMTENLKPLLKEV